MDDATAGRALRALRVRRGWRQVDLAAAARVSQSVVSRAERGRIDTLPLRTSRALFGALDAGCNLAPWWRSGQMDRLLDEDHAGLVAGAIDWLGQRGWSVSTEVTFSIYGERGSIDLLATRRSDEAALVVEVKTRLMSVEELLRTLDRKLRLATRIVEEREGWVPSVIGRLVVLTEDSTNRRRVDRAAVLNSALPLRGRAVAAWLHAPRERAAGLVFLSLSHAGTGIRRKLGRQGVRKAGSRTNGRATAPAQPVSVGHESVDH